MIFTHNSSSKLSHDLSAAILSMEYMPEMTLGEYLDRCREQHPLLYDCFDLTRLSDAEFLGFFAAFEASPKHFESEQPGGRGEAYRQAQRSNPLLRSRGVSKLFELMKPAPGVFSPADIVVDLLGGNGTMARAMARLQPAEHLPFIITSDISASMVCDALEQGMPAIRQPAQTLLLGDSTVDGVLLAYGTHHIPPEVRQAVINEAYRILKPGGLIVMQDFEEGTPTARWYSELLDQYTTTGHKFRHFTRSEMESLVTNAGFADAQIGYVYDPFVVQGDSAEDAQRKLVEHVCFLFGLVKLFIPEMEAHTDQWKQAQEKIRKYGMFSSDTMPAELHGLFEPAVTQKGNGYEAEFPRVALVAVGVKPVNT